MARCTGSGTDRGMFREKAPKLGAPPVAAAVPNFATIVFAAEAGTWAWTRAGSHPRLNELVTMAPSRAIPNTPPISRLVFVAAEATPAFRTGTDPMTAAVIGVIVLAMPAARTRNAGSRTVVYGEPRSVRSMRARPRAATSGPKVMNHRDPKRSERRPDSGATNRMIREKARSRTPAATGE